MLDRAERGAINFHPSPPRYPGSGGINRGLYNEDEVSGVTVHFMNEKVDSGDIIAFHKVEISQTDDVESLLLKVHKCQLGAFNHIINKIFSEGPDALDAMVKQYKGEPWGKHIGRIKEIDDLETVTCDITKRELDRVHRATSFGPFGPKINIHGYTFKLIGENNK